MAYESKDLLVAVKAYARGKALPLDKDEVWGSYAEAEAYAKSPTAYAGQTIKALVDGKYKAYNLDGEAGAYTLTPIGDVSQDDLKKYVQVVDALPETLETDVLYINTTDNKGYALVNDESKVVFENVDDLRTALATLETDVENLTTDVTGLKTSVEEINTALDTKAPIDNPTFTGKVTLAVNPTTDLEAATKQYVDRLISGIVNSAPGVVSSTQPLPTEGYLPGQTWRVAEAGTYAGYECETGDLIICVGEYAGVFLNSDFIVVQANIDGAVTGPDASTDANIVVFDGTSGKVIKDSEVTIQSLKDAIAKVAELETQVGENTTALETLEGTVEAQGTAISGLESDLAAKANVTDVYTKEEIDTQVSDLSDAIADKANSADVYTKTEVNNKLDEKANSADVYTKTETYTKSEIEAYVDTAVGTGGTDAAAAIQKAKEEAIVESKAYTDSSLELIVF